MIIQPGIDPSFKSSELVADINKSHGSPLQSAKEREFNAWFIKTLRSDKKYRKVRINCTIDGSQRTGLVCELTENEIKEILIHATDVEFVGIQLKPRGKIVLPYGWR